MFFKLFQNDVPACGGFQAFSAVLLKMLEIHHILLWEKSPIIRKY
jgi:hypothetical protein